MTFTDNYKNQHVLIFGLGLLGGGVATTNWFLKQGAKVTITDLKTKEDLTPSLKKIKGRVLLSLGQHKLEDLEAADVVVLNPGVSVHEALIQEAIKLGKQVVNEATVFYNSWIGKIIGITGTRGKTTTAHWTAHVMGDQAVLAGNSPDHPFLEVLSEKRKAKSTWAVTELSSFHLELFDASVRSPDIAVVTNIYRDHLNRYDSMEEYAQIKANLYRHQRPDQKLITEKEATPEAVKLDLAGFADQWGEHNLINVRMAALAANLTGIPWKTIQEHIATLPQIPFRQQVVYENDRLTVINDTAATSPEGGIAALRRFAGPDTVLIAGGTDRELDFTLWNEIVAKIIKPEHVILLEGSATKKMDATRYTICATLAECLQAALALQPKVILFSPACKSFEKFKNEYDRGEQFNELVRKLLPGHKQT